ncbi:YetF domain-containing protein [Natroniella sp. ANB-PHB2]|uniref:YetF domain-containing protein n=1 Tax=Natroniella sp. ANB-PHB2 TaxID=3384444 RepID=UPI0038D4C2C7
MLQLFLRTVLIYFLTLSAVRLMGKREIGELSPFDLVVSIMIAELAVIVIEDRGSSLWYGIIPILTLVAIEIIVSYISLKSELIRKLVSGTPNIIIRNGEIVKEELRNSRYTIHDLLVQLRQKDIFRITDVEFAILETSGDLSIIPKSQKRMITPKDLNLDTEYEGLPIILIADGKINYKNLKKLDLDEEWLLEKLKEENINYPDNVLLATLETNGDFYVAKK